MTPTHFRRLWRLLVPTMIVLTLDLWSAERRGPAVFGSAIVETQTEALLKILGIVVLALLGVASAKVLEGHAVRVRMLGLRGAARVPDLLLDNSDPRDQAVRRLRWSTLALAFALPLAAQIHFHAQLHDRPVRCSDGAAFSAYDPKAWTHFQVNSYCRIHDDRPAPAEEAQDGVTWFPGLQPVVLLGLTLWVVAAWARATYLVQR